MMHRISLLLFTCNAIVTFGLKESNLIKIITKADSAPKLWQVVYDPLRTGAHSIESSRSDGYLSDDSLVPNLRRNNRFSEEPGFDGYSFDVTICKEVNDRILCGYNKNIGENKDSEIVDLGNGCRTRGDRIECGYDGSYTHIELLHLRAKRLRTRTSSSDTVASLRIKPPEAVTIVPLVRSETLVTTDTNISQTNSSVPITSYSNTDDAKSSHHTKYDSKILNPQSLVRSDTANKNNTTVKGIDATILPTKSSIMFNMTLEANTHSPNNNISNPELETSTKLSTTIVTTKLPMFIVSESRTLNKSVTATSPSSNSTVKIKLTANTTNVLKTSSDKLEENITKDNISNEISFDSSKQLSKALGTNVTSTRADRDIVSTKFKNTETKMTKTKNLRKNNDETKIKTICVEQNDRIVCYDYKRS